MSQDYSQWEMKKAVSVTSLFLDPLNPRIPNASIHLSQDEVIAHLVENDNVYKLAKSIERLNYLPHEILIAVKEDLGDGEVRQYVLEGNRRLAALKALLSPASVPSSHRAKFEKLSGNVSFESIRKILVVFAPSRDAAVSLLMDRHTHTQVERWTRPMQASYFRRLHDDGYTIRQIAEKGEKTTGDVVAVLRADALYRAACSIDLDDDTAKKVENPNTFGLSTLERAFDSVLFRAVLGVQYDDKNLIIGTIPRPDFERVFTRLVTDIAHGRATSRTLDNEKAIKEYIAKLGKDRPSLERRGRFKILDLVTPERSISAVEAPTPRKLTRKANPKNVIPPDIKLSDVSKETRIRTVFVELRSLDLAKYVNASALLLRTLIDLCVWNYIQKNGWADEFLRPIQGKMRKGNDWSPSLAQSLKWLLKEKEIGFRGQPLAAIKRFCTDKNQALCLDSLDKFAHNSYSPPTPAELRMMWTTLDPLMRVILSDPQ
jgi:hypothetical protein